jgi:hypothetical protein
MYSLERDFYVPECFHSICIIPYGRLFQTGLIFVALRASLTPETLEGGKTLF